MPRPRSLGSFFARFEQRLQAEADAQERNARANALDQGIANLEIVERAHHLAEVADAGEYQLRRPLDAGGVSNELVLGSDRAQGVLDGAQVAGAVVEKLKS